MAFSISETSTEDRGLKSVILRERDRRLLERTGWEERRPDATEDAAGEADRGVGADISELVVLEALDAIGRGREDDGSTEADGREEEEKREEM